MLTGHFAVGPWTDQQDMLAVGYVQLPLVQPECFAVGFSRGTTSLRPQSAMIRELRHSIETIVRLRIGSAVALTEGVAASYCLMLTQVSSSWRISIALRSHADYQVRVYAFAAADD